MAAARQARASWNKLVDGSDQPCWVVDADWRIVLANPALQAWWGDGGEQLVGEQTQYGLSAETNQEASALAPPPEVFTGRAVSTTIVHPLAATRRLAVQWIPFSDAEGMIQSAWAWGSRADSTDQGSPPQAIQARISASTDWHALLAEHRARMREQGPAKLGRFVGTGLAMHTLRLQAERASALECTVWIHGPAGSGRRSLARAIQALDQQAQAYAEFDAAQLTPELFQRQLQDFAARLESLTAKSPGTQRANLLLANLEQLAESALAELQSFLQQQPVRLLLTSAGPPASFQDKPGWSTSWLAECSVHTIHVPALAARPADLPLVVQQLVEELNLAGNQQRRGCSLAALELLAAYRWPGDLAELAEVIRAAHQAAAGVEIQPADLPSWLRQAESKLTSPRSVPQAIDLDQQLGEIERELLARALRLADGNRTQAAKLVGWTRQRLLRRAEELGLIQPAPAKPPADEPEYIPDLPFEPEE